MRIAFIGNYQYSCGSSNTLLGYVRAGKILGHDVRVSEYGYVDKHIREIVPIATRSWDSDLLVIVYESYPFLSETDLDEIRSNVSRSKIVIVDPDCRYTEASESREYWIQTYDSLSDNILQPTLGNITKRNVSKFIYFGIDSNNSISDVKKDFDFLYVGNNWYRWKDIYNFVASTSRIRDRLCSIAVMGNYWDEKTMNGYEKVSSSVPEFLQANNVSIIKPAPYGKVENSMSRGLINPIYIRPLLNKLMLVTPRMFETFLADTVVVIPEYFKHAVSIYGDDVSRLTMPDNPNDFILNILDNYRQYSDVCRKIRNKLIQEHSYQTRLNELISFA